MNKIHTPLVEDEVEFSLCNILCNKILYATKRNVKYYITINE